MVIYHIQCDQIFLYSHVINRLLLLLSLVSVEIIAPPSGVDAVRVYIIGDIGGMALDQPFKISNNCSNMDVLFSFVMSCWKIAFCILKRYDYISK